MTGPDAGLNSRDRRQWLWRAVGLAGLAGAAAACFWLFLIVRKQSGQPGWAAPLLAVGGFVAAVAAVAQVLLAWLQLRQGIRAKSVEQLAPHEQRDREARDRLRQHLGRRDRLPQMDETLALALGVQPAIDLPQRPGSGAVPSAETDSRPGRWRRRFLPRPLRGRRSKPRTLDQEQDLPTFFARQKGPEIRNWLREARDNGGFLVLVGDSSVGKTRLLYEAARKELGEFAVLAPDPGDGDLVNKIAGASLLPAKLIVWLDELQRFLDGPYFTTPESKPITCATVRLLLDAPTPVIIVGTLWPIYNDKLRGTELDPATGQERPRHPNALDILTDRRLHGVSLETFSNGEREEAKLLKSQDPRLKEALADRDYGVTEALAGAPQLMRRYEQATKEQEAVLNAAIDARRVGIQAMLSEDLLCEAARGYLSAVHADDTWFRKAMDDLISPRRATAPLIRVPSADRRRWRGVTVADYLLQHLTQRRRSVPLPGVTWQALIDHTNHHDDLVRLGRAAHNRLLYSCAESIYRRLSGAGDEHAAEELAELLARQGRADELRALANAGDEHAAQRLDWLVELLARQGRTGEAIELQRIHPKADHEHAAEELAELLARQGREELRVRQRRRAWVLLWLAELLAGQGRTGEAIEVLRLRAYADDGGVLRQLPGLLAGQGRIEMVQVGVNPDTWHAAKLLAEELPELLAGQGSAGKAIEVLRVRARAGDRGAAKQLAEELPELLAGQGSAGEAIKVLWDRTKAGDWWAAEQLAELLAGQGHAKEARKVLRTEVDAGTPTAAERLITMLAEQGETASAARMRRFGLNPDDPIADEDSGNQ